MLHIPKKTIGITPEEDIENCLKTINGDIVFYNRC